MLFEAIANGEPPSPRGLVNLGNTCFFNAVMQCLTRVAHFREHFVFQSAAPGEGAMTTAIRTFLVDQWKVGESSELNPILLFSEVGKKNPSFRGRAQQDAHELMKVIFDAVLDEEKARLTKVARGILPPFARDDENDSPSETSLSTSADYSDTLTEEHAGVANHTDHPSPSSVAQTASEPERSPADDIVESETATEPEDPDPSSNDMGHLKTGDASGEDEKPIPPEKLVTIIERAVGGVLSSTIVCKECGTKSAVSEPFLDLQIPLVPKDAPDPRVAKDSDTTKKSWKKDVDEKQVEGDKPEKESEAEAEKLSPSTVVIVPAVPPPPPPLPPPPTSLANYSKASSSSGTRDLMQELRQKVEVEAPSAEPAPDSGLSTESQTVLHHKELANSIANEVTETQISDDDEADGMPSLFDSSDNDDGDDTAVDEINDMNAFSTSECARENDASAASSSAGKEIASCSPGPRRAPAFISTLFGGFGCISPAPHGYRSVVGSLEEFTKVEVLEGDNAYGCEECNRREKLRVAMQRFDSISIKAKKIEASAEVFADDVVGESDVSAVDEGQARKRPGDSTDSTESSNSSENESTSSKVGTRDKNSQPVMMSSSPVTSSSSEGGSGTTSEEEGEVVIEEELEEPRPSKPVRQRTLTREEEDALIKNLDVKVPVVRSAAEKRFVVKRAPDVLAIQLKRFAQVGFRGGLRKISGHVDFPLEFDLAPFVDESASEELNAELKEKSSAAKRKRSVCSLYGNGKIKAYKYALTGVTVHGGSLSGGHYTAYVREGVDSDHRGGWYFCNDAKIQRAKERDVLRSEAYLLYYERVPV
ncbi:unnamed protein product [Chondrus crispus]|uniref:Ubiquitin carboxyl-terminal hydrolase n=1 Tax=Chondrus crispus TaxID=2769 RepID=R7QJJ9_CHOCR|nr:unnamed protein product [Chondrus crispus]CDF37641.1 unnamed protein product [Chondrus crispus]|eukprot:XP_005717512.1 unnamed protein product [Chondrus crispus]